MIIRISLIFIIFIMISCTSKKSDIKNGNDVEYIQYKLDQLNRPTDYINLDEEFKIDGYSEAGKKKFFGLIVDFMVDGNGIYLVDYTSSNIYLFNHQGEFLRKIGRKGKGPQETMQPGPVFKIDSNYYWMSQIPSKLIEYNQKFNFKRIIEIDNIFWLKRKQNNSPMFYITHNVSLDNNNVYQGYTRGFHTFKLDGHIVDTIATIDYMKNEQIKGNVYHLKYTPPVDYQITDDSTLWINDTYEYLLKIRNKFRKDKNIFIETKKIKLTQESQKQLIEEFESKNLNSMLSRAGLKIKLENPPNFLKAIGRILYINNKIWVVLNKEEKEKYFTIHVYNQDALLERIIKTSSDVFIKAKRIFLESNNIFALIEDEEGFIWFKKFKINFH